MLATASREIIISGSSAEEFFKMKFPEMRKVLTFLKQMDEGERISACWRKGGDLTILIKPKSEAYKRWERRKRPSLRNFSPQERRGKNSYLESTIR